MKETKVYIVKQPQEKLDQMQELEGEDEENQ